jgi:hypothetical protein
MQGKVLIIIVLLFFYHNSNSQNYIDENYDCELLNWRFEHIDAPTAVDTILIDVECLIIRNQYEKGMSLLDSLIQKNKDYPELYLQKAYYQADYNRFDTAYFANFRKALKLGADTSFTLYNLGVYYYNYLLAFNDSTFQQELSSSEIISLINQAEHVVRKSAIYDKEYLSYSYEFLSMSKQLKADVRNENLTPFSVEVKFDTLLLMSQLMDCGEFGGHIEYIKCYYDNEKLKAIFWKDDPICQIEVPEEELADNDYRKAPQEITENILNQYVNHVINIDRNPSMMTNAPTSFWMVKDGDPFFICDWTGNSEEYELFRNTIFKK